MPSQSSLALSQLRQSVSLHMLTLPLRLKSVKPTLLSLALEQVLQAQPQAVHPRHLIPGLQLAKSKLAKIWHHSTELVELVLMDHLAKPRLIQTSPLNLVFLLVRHGEPLQFLRLCRLLVQLNPELSA